MPPEDKDAALFPGGLTENGFLYTDPFQFIMDREHIYGFPVR